MQVEAFIFDVFGTVVDWRNSVANCARTVFEEKNIACDAYAFADYWRGQYAPAMARVREGERAYVPLDDLHYENLEASLLHFGLEDRFNVDEKRQFNKVWEQLNPWPGAVAGLNVVKQKAIIAPCSNGSIALMTRLARYGALPWDCILGAELAQNYKPEASVYQACCKALRLREEQVMMVAAHESDLVAAKAAGLRTGFIHRPLEYGNRQASWPTREGEWDRVIEDFSQLVAYI